jgi:hypothetical protein
MADPILTHSLDLPDTLRKLLLPSDTSTIPSVLGLQIAPVFTGYVSATVDDFFVPTPEGYSALVPNLSTIRQVPMPPSRLIEELRQSASHHHQDDIAIQPVHLPEEHPLRFVFLPLCTLDYWQSAHVVLQRLPRWRQVQSSIDRFSLSSTPTDVDLAQRVRETLRLVQWEGINYGVNHVDQLTELFHAKQWLNTAHADGLLNLIAHHPSLSPHIEILETHHMMALFGADNESAWETWLNDLAQRGVEDGKTFATIIHIHENHFVALVIDIPGSTILYGDSMGGWAPDKYMSIVIGWLRDAHMAIGRSYFDFAVHPLDIGLQDDTWNCLLFAVNALRVNLLDNGEELMPSDHSSGEQCRLQAFVDLVNLSVSISCELI